MATEDLVRTGSYEPWKIDANAIEAAAADIADNICLDKRTVLAWCPTIGLRIPDGEGVELEPGIHINAWSAETRCVFLTRYHREYLDGDVTTWASHAVIQIVTNVGDLSENAPRMAVAATLDRIKWALSVAANKDAAILEGPVILRSPSGWHGDTLRRGDTLRWNRSIPTIDLTAETSMAAKTLLQQLRTATTHTRELDGALWLFGRACNASLPRDALLDAAIGLEMLLVPGPGEARYRFGLHGMALIADESPHTIEATLKRIYKLRSEAAHGDTNDLETFSEVASQARFLLARAVQSAVRLINAGELDVVTTNGDIGKAVEQLVKIRLAKSSTESPTETRD
jgi:hypothetical protein